MTLVLFLITLLGKSARLEERMNDWPCSCPEKDAKEKDDEGSEIETCLKNKKSDVRRNPNKPKKTEKNIVCH